MTRELSAHPIPSSFHPRNLVWLTVILMLAAGLRMWELTSQSYVLDEDWSLEIATGRGSLHLNLPTDRVINPPPSFFSLNDAPAWPSIWTHMEVTHPPLYPILLRWWEDVVGDTDYGGRLFSVICSVMAVALLFDTVLLQGGLTIAVWAALLMAVAQPQVDYARLTRSYPLLTAIALVMANVLTRIQVLGPSRRRWVLLTLSIFLTLMTHYFCLGTIIALMMYSAWTLKGDRNHVVLMFVTAGCLFAIVWGYWMWQQRHLFATDDPSTTFLVGDAEGHVKYTFFWFLSCPAQLLFPHSGLGLKGTLSFAVGIALYLSPFLKKVRSTSPFAAMWGLWLLCTIGVVASLDFTRGTEHLRFVRYTLLAAPAVFALIPILLSCLIRTQMKLNLTCGIAFILCLINLPAVYQRAQIEPRTLVNQLIARPGPNDLLVMAGRPDETTVCDIEILLLSRYLQPGGCPLVILTRPAGPDVIDAAKRSRLVFLDSQQADYHAYFPDAQVLAKQSYHGLGNILTLDFGSKPK